MYISRALESQIQTYQNIFPVTAILGPRQCGKSTLIKHLMQLNKNLIYLDLQNLEDINKLNDPYLFFRLNQDKIICLDEIQLMPQIFAVLRSVVDEKRVNGRFILLGSASRILVQQSSESLAGRIGYLNLSPFNLNEIPKQNWTELWLKGGFPNSYLLTDESHSYIWRQNYIQSFIEKDISLLGFQIPNIQLKRFLSLSAHQHAQTVNYSKIAANMDMASTSIKRYFDLFEQTFMLRSLLPYEVNLKKRLVKTPKIYFRDSGILHTILGIKNLEMLFGHPIFGGSWEGFVIEQILSTIEVPAYFYRSANGDEIDLILEINSKIIAIECKASSAPTLTKGFYKAVEIIKPQEIYVVAPIKGDAYFVNENIKVIDVYSLIQHLKTLV
jgi:predicted AAA+ superfamily ATPase